VRWKGGKGPKQKVTRQRKQAQRDWGRIGIHIQYEANDIQKDGESNMPLQEKSAGTLLIVVPKRGSEQKMLRGIGLATKKKNWHKQADWKLALMAKWEAPPGREGRGLVRNDGSLRDS